MHDQLSTGLSVSIVMDSTLRWRHAAFKVYGDSSAADVILSLSLAHATHCFVGTAHYLHRIVSIWNSLPDSVVSAESVKSFKSRLDKFWSMHDFVYDYRYIIDIIDIKSNVLIMYDKRIQNIYHSVFETHHWKL